MKKFADDSGREWVATAVEEHTPRHHGRWYLVFQISGAGSAPLPMPEVRWQNAATAERTIQAMSEFELRKRLGIVRGRSGAPGPAD